MSGLQPSGLGRSGNFGPLTTEQATNTQEEISEPVVRAYLATEDETTSATGGTYVDYPVSDYADVMAAAQQALTDSGRSSTIVLPPGTYETGTQVTLTNLQALKSPGGAGSTRLIWRGSSGSSPIKFADGQFCIHVEGIEFECGPSSAGNAMRFDQAYQCSVKRCRFIEWPEPAIVSLLDDSGLHFTSFENLFFENPAGTGYSFADMTAITIGNTWENCSFREIPENGLGLSTFGADNITNCEFLGKGTSPAGALRIGPGKGWRVEGCNFENLSDLNGSPAADAIRLGASNKQWREGAVVNNNYGGVQGVNSLVNVDRGGIDEPTLKLHQNRGFGTYGPLVDWEDSTAGWVDLYPFEPARIANDGSNRVIGRTETGDPVVQADDGSGKYQITVDGTGTISTTSV